MGKREREKALHQSLTRFPEGREKKLVKVKCMLGQRLEWALQRGGEGGE